MASELHPPPPSIDLTMHLHQPVLWRDPPKPLTLGKADVHVWLAPLAARSGTRLEVFLSADEQERARRFKFIKDRNAFIVARGILRSLLGQYLAVPPSAIRFAYNRFGRPVIVDPAPEDLQFNVTHSGKLALYVVARRQVGIDVEQMRTGLDFNGIATNYFSRHEQAELQSVAEAVRPIAFYNCWTRKEAYIKARGLGLSMPLDTFDVSCRPGDVARLLAIRNADDSAERWSMQAIPPGAGYVGALVVEGTDWLGHYWRYPSSQTLSVSEHKAWN